MGFPPATTTETESDTQQWKTHMSNSKHFSCHESSRTLYVALVEAEDYKELTTAQQKLNEAVMEMNQRLQAANIQTMDVELVAQMFKNYQSNVLFHLEATDNLKEPS
ncbi:hypothetical protein BDW60DRAFT_206467 [Aspergillus nidulans var. acristatus]